MVLFICAAGCVRSHAVIFLLHHESGRSGFNSWGGWQGLSSRQSGAISRQCLTTGDDCNYKNIPSDWQCWHRESIAARGAICLALFSCILHGLSGEQLWVEIRWQINGWQLYCIKSRHDAFSTALVSSHSMSWEFMPRFINGKQDFICTVCRLEFWLIAAYSGKAFCQLNSVLPNCGLASWWRFEIEKKLREAKRKEKSKQKAASQAAVISTASVSQRSIDRRKNIEDKKDTKKLSALQDLKAKREEKKKQGTLLTVAYWFVNEALLLKIIYGIL